jgi:hypothetical protein
MTGPPQRQTQPKIQIKKPDATMHAGPNGPGQTSRKEQHGSQDTAQADREAADKRKVSMQNITIKKAFNLAQIDKAQKHWMATKRTDIKTALSHMPTATKNTPSIPMPQHIPIQYGAEQHEICMLSELDPLVHGRTLEICAHAYNNLKDLTQHSKDSPAEKTQWERIIKPALEWAQGERNIELGDVFTKHIMHPTFIPNNLYDPTVKQKSPQYPDTDMTSIFLITLAFENANAWTHKGTIEISSDKLLHASRIPKDLHITDLKTNNIFRVRFPKTHNNFANKNKLHHALIPYPQETQEDEQTNKKAPKKTLPLYGVKTTETTQGEITTDPKTCDKRASTIYHRYTNNAQGNTQCIKDILYPAAYLVERPQTINIANLMPLTDCTCQECLKVMPPTQENYCPTITLAGVPHRSKPDQKQAHTYERCHHPICNECYNTIILERIKHSPVATNAKSIILKCPGRGDTMGCPKSGTMEIQTQHTHTEQKAQTTTDSKIKQQHTETLTTKTQQHSHKPPDRQVQMTTAEARTSNLIKWHKRQADSVKTTREAIKTLDPYLEATPLQLQNYTERKLTAESKMDEYITELEKRAEKEEEAERYVTEWERQEKAQEQEERAPKVAKFHNDATTEAKEESKKGWSGGATETFNTPDEGEGSTYTTAQDIQMENRGGTDKVQEADNETAEDTRGKVEEKQRQQQNTNSWADEIINEEEEKLARLHDMEKTTAGRQELKERYIAATNEIWRITDKAKQLGAKVWVENFNLFNNGSMFLQERNAKDVQTIGDIKHIPYPWPDSYRTEVITRDRNDGAPLRQECRELHVIRVFAEHKNATELNIEHVQNLFNDVRFVQFPLCKISYKITMTKNGNNFYCTFNSEMEAALCYHFFETNKESNYPGLKIGWGTKWTEPAKASFQQNNSETQHTQTHIHTMQNHTNTHKHNTIESHNSMQSPTHSSPRRSPTPTCTTQHSSPMHSPEPTHSPMQSPTPTSRPTSPPSTRESPEDIQYTSTPNRPTN